MLRLSQQDVDGAVDLQDFQSQWRRFLKVDDVLVVNHSGNAKMIDRVGATDHDVLVLKSITSLPDVDETTISPIDLTRAAERLAMAVAKVPALRVPS
jgi:hypothetical protein